MRTSPATGAPRVSDSAPLASVSSRFEKPPEPRSKTPCTRQSVPLLAGLEMQVPSARRIVRPGQCRPWLADFAASRCSMTALRKSTARSRRYLTAGLTEQQKIELRELVIKGPDPATDHVVRWRCVDLKAVVARRFSVEVHEITIGKWLNQLGLTRLQPRPYHPKKDAEAEATFKKRA